jgi:hypothetical protein
MAENMLAVTLNYKGNIYSSKWQVRLRSWCPPWWSLVRHKARGYAWTGTTTKLLDDDDVCAAVVPPRCPEQVRRPP